jgi:hypothetical protein
MASPEALGAQQSADQPGARQTVPEVGGHVFAPSFLVDSPFRSTNIRFALLYGIGDATAPTYSSTGAIIGQNDYSLGAFGQTLGYEYRFADWLSVGADAESAVYSGLNGPSVISVGAQVGVALEGTLKAGHRFGPVETAIVIAGGSAPDYVFLIAGALVRAIQSRTIDSGSLFQSTHTLSIGSSLAASWAPWSSLGLTANAGYLYKSLKVSGVTKSSQNAIRFAAAADFDFGKISPVSIGLLAGYRITAPAGSDEIPITQDLSAGISYTGVRELGLAFEFGWRSLPLRAGTSNQLHTNATVGQARIQFFW